MGTEGPEGKRVLVVDDEETIRHVVRQVLEEQGCEVLDAGADETTRTVFDPRAVVDQVRVGLTRAAETKGLQLDIAADEDVPRDMVGAPQVLVSVLTRIVENAIKFTESGAIAIRLSSDASTNGSPKLRFEVEDSGIGIPEESRAHVFDAFRQSDSSCSRSHGGVGLGLTLAKRLVERMEGSIGFRDNGGPGSTFWVTLPLVCDANVVAQDA